MTTVQLIALSGLIFMLFCPIYWALVRTVEATLRIAEVLEIAHEAEILGMRDHWKNQAAERQKAERDLRRELAADQVEQDRRHELVDDQGPAWRGPL